MIDPAPSPDPFAPAAPGPGFQRSGGARLHDPHASTDERTFACFEHLSYGFWFIGVPIVVTLILWLIKKGDSPFLDDHGRESLNMQISLLIYSFMLGVLGFVTCGVAWGLAVAVPLVAGVFAVLAAMAANRGEYYRYPAVIRFF